MKSLKIDDRGGITYHGTTSFFNLPSERATTAPGDFLALTSTSDSDAQRRQRLIHHAWQQRALENLNDIPVRTTAVVVTLIEGC